MKIRPLLLTTAAIVLAAFTTQGQTAKSSKCMSQEHMQQLQQQDPSLVASQAAWEQQIQQFISQKQNQRSSGAVIKIPVVVHVVTEKGCAGISKAQILDGLEVINQDFRRQNPDTANTRAIFKPYAADTEIEFVLASKDPVGWATDGINRVTSSTAKGSANRDDVKIAVPAWDPTKYFNIWIVDRIYDSQVGTDVLGYAQFPHLPGQLLNTFGVVLVNTAWGKQGAVAGSTANTLGHYATHEIAHCLHLLHIETNTCIDGDMIPDTPPSLGATTLGCDFNQNTCTNDPAVSSYTTDVPDQIENYMSWATNSCQNMFTNGQKMRMQASLLTYPHLQNLISPANAIFTGIDPAASAGPAIPSPYFCPSSTRICAGSTITFSDKTYNAQATSLQWNFPGGTPATSTDQNPVVTYNTPGVYDVTLTATNPIGVRTINQIKQVTVVPVTGLIDVTIPNYYVENFEEQAFPANAAANRVWEVQSSALNPSTSNWSNVTGANVPAGSTINRSMKLANSTIPHGTVSTLITPNFSITGGAPSQVVGMYIAYAPNNATPREELRISYSIDCGATWSAPIGTFTGSQLVTNGGAIVANNFTPVYSAAGSNDWRLETMPIMGTTPQPASHIMFKIDAISNGGGNLYLDHFFIGSVLGTKEDLAAKHAINVFPNPLTAETAISFELKTAEKTSVKITDMLGKAVYSGPETSFSAGKHSISLTEKAPGLSAGVYLVQLKIAGKVYNTKLLVQ